MCHGIFRRSNRGGAPDAVGFANAPTGCNTIDSWKMKFGDCDPRDAIPASAPTSSSAPASTSASTTAKRGDGYKESFANSDGQQIQFEWLMGTDLLFGACLSVGGRDHDCCKRRKGGDSARWRGLELMVLLGDEYVCNMRKEAW